MGSYCTIYFDTLEICNSKSAVPDMFSAVFQESDRKVGVSRFEGEDTPEVVYETTRDVVISRLDLMGCTSQIARERLSEWIADEKETWQQYVRDSDSDWAVETEMAIRDFTIDEWNTRVPEVLTRRRIQEEPIDAIDRHMREHDSRWLWFDGYDSLVGFRALLDANPLVEKVTLDVSDLIHGGWIDETDCLSQRHPNESIHRMGPMAPTVILAEGRSDINILKRSLSVLFPEREDFFSFFEHKELNVDGGAAYLVKFLKAFAAARTPLRFVAVFDNDTAGRQAHRQATELGLPDNMILLQLPDTDLAKTYPTIGPQGFHTVNVNGQAASIELYLGRKALEIAGNLRPVRWTGYDRTAGAYQGEVESKDEIKRLFFQQLSFVGHPTEARDALPELVDIWKAIFAVVERSAEQAERKAVNYGWRDF